MQHLYVFALIAHISQKDSGIGFAHLEYVRQTTMWKCEDNRHGTYVTRQRGCSNAVGIIIGVLLSMLFIKKLYCLLILKDFWYCITNTF